MASFTRVISLRYRTGVNHAFRHLRHVGPTDPTRAMLPFIFAASAVQDGDTVTLMLFHDAVLMAVDGAGAKLVPVATQRYEEVVSIRT